jgi:hypothetical protein
VKITGIDSRSGDSHAFWAVDLFGKRQRLVAAGFATSLILSLPVGGALLQHELGRLLAAAKGEVAFSDHNVRGFAVLTPTRDMAVPITWLSRRSSSNFIGRRFAPASRVLLGRSKRLQPAT